jgi:hypothetical protein
MPYINNDGDSRLNNFPTEPKMYVTNANEAANRKNYLAIGITGVVLVLGMILVATAVS